jgi:hypothetical protein
MAVEDIKLTLPELLDSLALGDELTRITVPGTFSGRNLFRSVEPFPVRSFLPPFLPFKVPAVLFGRHFAPVCRAHQLENGIENGHTSFGDTARNHRCVGVWISERDTTH